MAPRIGLLHSSEKFRLQRRLWRSGFRPHFHHQAAVFVESRERLAACLALYRPHPCHRSVKGRNRPPAASVCCVAVLCTSSTTKRRGTVHCDVSLQPPAAKRCSPAPAYASGSISRVPAGANAVGNRDRVQTWISWLQVLEDGRALKKLVAVITVPITLHSRAQIPYIFAIPSAWTLLLRLRFFVDFPHTIPLSRQRSFCALLLAPSLVTSQLLCLTTKASSPTQDLPNTPSVPNEEDVTISAITQEKNRPNLQAARQR